MRSRISAKDDSGAALVLALILVTVVGIVTAVVLSFADSSLRTTVNLRAQAATAANADGAAQIAINKLRTGTYNGSANKCFGSAPTDDTVSLAPTVFGSTDSYAVTCAPDTANSAADPNVAITSANRPGSAILTLGTSTLEDGINLKVSSNGTLKVHGGVFSNSNINVAQGSLDTNASVTARTNCTGTITSIPTKACNIGAAVDTRGLDPNYPAPTAAATPQSVPSCNGNNKLVTFTPGLYDATDIAALNNMTKSSGCKNSIFYFPPGTYYFNFPASTPWVIDTGYVVGGTPTTPLVAGTAPTIPGACQSPIPPDPLPPGGWTKPGPNAGVQFVFGGGSQIDLKAAQAEICGTYSATSPPIAVYGLKTAVGGVPAQSGCTIAPAGCPVILTENSPNSKFYIQGTTYVPNASLNISLNNATGQVFRFGVIARSLSLSPTGSADLSSPVIEVPDEQPAYGLRTVVYLNVYVCPGVSTCSASGTLRLRAKVGILDPSGLPDPPKRQILVYSWSVQR